MFARLVLVLYQKYRLNLKKTKLGVFKKSRLLHATSNENTLTRYPEREAPGTETERERQRERVRK